MTPDTSPAGQAMIRIPRPRIDWEAIERDYRAGTLTLREIASKHGCTHGRVAQVAKERDWTRGDLAHIVRKATQTAMLRASEVVVARPSHEEAVAAEAEEGANRAVRELNQGLNITVSAAVETNLRVMRSHRSHLADLTADFLKVKAKLLVMVDGVADLREAATAMSAIESGSRTLKTLIDKERQVFGLDEGDHGGEQSWEQELAEMHRTMLLARA
jgi:hypothetical protein